MSPIVTAAIKDAYEGLPSWVRIVSILGFPVAVAAFVLWVALGGEHGLAATAARTEQKLDAHTLKADERAVEQSGFYHEHEVNERYMKAILAQICANGAKTRADRDACFPETVTKGR